MGIADVIVDAVPTRATLRGVRIVVFGGPILDHDVPAEKVEHAIAITLGLKSPTMAPLHDRDWCAVRAKVRSDETNLTMDGQFAVGARDRRNGAPHRDVPASLA